MKYFSVFLQFILGFFVGILLLVSGTTALAYVVFYRLNTSPPKPIFAEEKQEKAAEPSTLESNAQEKAKKSKEKMAARESELFSEIQKKEKKGDLPSGAYRASVIWPSGLSLRSEPDQDAQRIGGIDYKAELIILKTSSDGDWQNVRISRSGQEGWVKAGNIQKIE
ncbi:SH3 domain-containing protein [Cyanobacterium sp. uoEpiScrs1]|uniref:SH3 domain-containing protein n=1 Tax=Cyanobacterium sp. uoEpiScrs1 TaxID=2976343 RepID=UPI0022697F2C|nr:SH3 domain-containing protein [Cyanobacterium sp. uoEpiScrs1]